MKDYITAKERLRLKKARTYALQDVLLIIGFIVICIFGSDAYV